MLERATMAKSESLPALLKVSLDDVMREQKQLLIKKGNLRQKRQSGQGSASMLAIEERTLAITESTLSDRLAGVKAAINLAADRATT